MSPSGLDMGKGQLVRPLESQFPLFPTVTHPKPSNPCSHPCTLARSLGWRWWEWQGFLWQNLCQGVMTCSDPPSGYSEVGP